MDEIIKLYNQNLPLQEIADLQGLKIRTLCRRLAELKKAGLILQRETRKRGTGFNELIGLKFGHLTIIGTEPYKNNTYRLRCLCDCGRECLAFKNALDKDHKKTCAHQDCQFHRREYKNYGNRNPTFTGFEGIHGSKWSGMKAGAVARGIGFNLNIEEVWSLYESQDRKCAITGLPIGFGKTYKDGNTASLDRIESWQDYTIDNVWWVHKDVNKMKMDLPMDRFIQLCRMAVAKADACSPHQPLPSKNQ